MGHRPYQHPILNDGAAGHPLHDASGDFQQIWVGDADDHVFGRLLLGERNLLDIGVKIGGVSPEMVVRIWAGPSVTSWLCAMGMVCA